MSGRLFDPMRKDGTFPFQISDKTATNVRETWDRMCPGWRDRKPGNYDRVLCSIKPRLKAKQC